ncbi:MAG: 2-C-methyl-D-erythritol 2,4-cyclodiphosphate synthase [Chloroflexi bacterium]|nr:2-C-methyl-D-erythritol 2,4-cyclodiphosphate synthase [Chloroflexota bacterium]
MGGSDKLSIEIDGRPLLAWTLAAVAAVPTIRRIVVVTTRERRSAIEAADWLPAAVSEVVIGGGRRQESVHAGFMALDAGATDEYGVVLVHDGARPLVQPSLIEAVIDATARHGAAIPIVPVAETLKRIDGEWVGTTVDRTALGAAQTPQGVRRDVLREAYQRFKPGDPTTFTDEAALLEACSIAVHVVSGDPGNLKVTLAGDLGRAAAVLGRGRTARTGIGHDSHPFGPDMGLRLGGIEIAAAPRLAGHSDGDVVLHAMAEALLGATGQGDLGRLFPADSRTPRGIAGRALIDEVARRVAEAGWRPVSIDLTIIAARPRLGDVLDPMREAIAEMLGLATDAVNVKASSGNLDGSEGAGRTISALAVATVEPVR